MNLADLLSSMNRFNPMSRLWDRHRGGGGGGSGDFSQFQGGNGSGDGIYNPAPPGDVYNPAPPDDGINNPEGMYSGFGGYGGWGPRRRY